MTMLDMYTNIYTMRQDLERLKKPIGTKENPARTCKDLYYGYPKFKGRARSLTMILLFLNSFNLII